jgi:hypothetical protein
MLQTRRIALARQNWANISQRSSPAEPDGEPGEAVDMSCAFISQVVKNSPPLAISGAKTDTASLSLLGPETALLDPEDYAKLHPTGLAALPTADLKADPVARRLVTPEYPTALAVLSERELLGMLPTA